MVSDICGAPESLRIRVDGHDPGPKPTYLVGFGPGSWNPGALAAPMVGGQRDRGGGGDRTRVLQYLTRASPGAACCAFLSPGGHAGESPTGSAAVRCPV